MTVRLAKLLGENWQTETICGNKLRESRSKKNNERHVVCYTATDIWNVCFETDDPEDIKEFAKKSLRLDDEHTKLLVRLWSSIVDGYASLSLKAINNINRQLRRGLIYSDAVMLAKLPYLTKVNDSEMDSILADLQDIANVTKNELLIAKIANTLIANYKS